MLKKFLFLVFCTLPTFGAYASDCDLVQEPSKVVIEYWGIELDRTLHHDMNIDELRKRSTYSFSLKTYHACAAAFIYSLEFSQETKYQPKPEDFMARGVFRLKFSEKESVTLYSDAKLVCSDAGCVKANPDLYKLMDPTYSPITARIFRLN